jgi:hypothetical protein
MTSRDRFIRDLVGAVVPLLWLALAVGPFLAAWHRLPDPMAAHWSGSGAPDGEMSRAGALALVAAMAGLPAIAALAMSRRAPRRRGELAPRLALAAFVGAFGAAIALVLVALNLDAPTWRDARPLPLGWLVAASAVPLAVAAAVSRAARRLESLPDAAPVRRASVGLGATERAVWTGSAGNPWFAAVGLGLVVSGLASLPLAGAPLPTTFIAAGLALGVFSLVRLRVDGSGLTVAYGPLGLPRQRVPLSRIRGARAIDVTPLRHGGWGYRGSLLVFGRAAIVVRRGAGIQVDCDRGSLVITIDDAETAAGLVNDLVDRARGTG